VIDREDRHGEHDRMEAFERFREAVQKDVIGFEKLCSESVR